MSQQKHQALSHAMLLNEFLELHDQIMENQEDVSLAKSAGESTQANFSSVREELMRRLPSNPEDRNPYERIRVRDVMTDEAYFQTTCLSCHKKIQLWWNGGELDYAKCCGYTYELQHGPIDFVVTREEK